VVALLAKNSPLGYQGLMWTTAAAMALQFVCLAPVLAGGQPRAALGGGGDVSVPPSAAGEDGAADSGGGGGGGSGSGSGSGSDGSGAEQRRREQQGEGAGSV
jgi:hypothetical protein